MPDDPVTVDVRGLDELNRAIGRLVDNIDQHSAETFKQTADQVATMVRSRVPKRSGRLAASVRGQKGDHLAAVTMGDGVPYAGWIEFGGGHGRAYLASGRYLYPTAHQAVPLFQRAGETAARQQIGAMRWPTPT